MKFNIDIVYFKCILGFAASLFFISCGGDKNNTKHQIYADDSLAIAQEILESKNLVADRDLRKKEAEDSFYNATFENAKSFLNGFWYCILNEENGLYYKSFDLYLFDFDVDAEILVNKIKIVDDANIGNYIKHENNYRLPFDISDEIIPLNTELNNYKLTYSMRKDLEGEKFFLTVLGGVCQTLSFNSDYNLVVLSKLPKVMLKNGETIEVFPKDIAMSDRDEAKHSCSQMIGEWRLPSAEEFEGIYSQLYQNESYGFKKFLYWTSSELNTNWYHVAFDTRFGKITGHKNTAYVRPVRSNNH